MSVLEVYLVLEAVPEVDGLGDEGVVLGLEEVLEVVLGLEEVLEDVAEEGSLALAEVLALGGLAVTVAGCIGGCAEG